MGQITKIKDFKGLGGFSSNLYFALLIAKLPKLSDI